MLCNYPSTLEYGTDTWSWSDNNDLWNLRYVTSRKSEDPNYKTADTWNVASLTPLFKDTKWEGKQQDIYIVPAQCMCISDKVTFQVSK